MIFVSVLNTHTYFIENIFSKIFNLKVKEHSAFSKNILLADIKLSNRVCTFDYKIAVINTVVDFAFKCVYLRRCSDVCVKNNFVFNFDFFACANCRRIKKLIVVKAVVKIAD